MNKHTNTNTKTHKHTHTHKHLHTQIQTHTHTHTHTQSARRAYDAPHGGQSCLIVEQVRSLQTTTSLTGEAATVMKKQHLRWSSLPRPWSPVRHARRRPEARTHAHTIFHKCTHTKTPTNTLTKQTTRTTIKNKTTQQTRIAKEVTATATVFKRCESHGCQEHVLK